MCDNDLNDCSIGLSQRDYFPFFQALQQQSHKALIDIVDSIKENSITMLYGLMKVFFWRN